MQLNSEQIIKMVEDIAFIKSKVVEIEKQTIKTNGTIKTHEERINCLESDIDQLRGASKTVHIIWGTIVAIIGIIISLIKIK